MKLSILPGVLAIIFLLSGGAKLASLPFEVEAFARWGYPLWFMYLTGVLELAGVIGLLLPRLSALAGACLAGLMVGAVLTHLVHAEWPMLIIAASIMLLAAWHGWRGRENIRQLLKTVKP